MYLVRMFWRDNIWTYNETTDLEEVIKLWAFGSGAGVLICSIHYSG